MKPTCDTCKAFYPLNRECRRHAPIMVPIPQQGAGGVVAGYAALGMYPATDKDKGCAEHIVDDSPKLQ